MQAGDDQTTSDADVHRCEKRFRNRRVTQEDPHRDHHCDQRVAGLLLEGENPGFIGEPLDALDILLR